MDYDLGKNIQYYRKKKNFTLKALGEAVGYAENSVWQWENNKREPNVRTLLLLSGALEIEVIELLGGKKMENGKFIFHEKEYSLKEELQNYDGSLPDWKIEEYLTFKLRVISWCEENHYAYEHSIGRELLLIPIENSEWGEEAGILLEVPEHDHFGDNEQYEESPLVFFSLGNEEDGYSVQENIDLSLHALEETIRKMKLYPIKK